MFNWQIGRQNGNYLKYPVLISHRFKFDIYLLKFLTGSYVTKHTDKVNSLSNHHRINIVLKQAKKGGRIEVDGLVHWFFRRRVMYFRPDLYVHSMEKVTEGRGLLLSIGWLTFKNNEK